MWRFVSSLADTTAGLHLFECVARVMKPLVEASEIEPNIRLIILFLLISNIKTTYNIHYAKQKRLT